MDEAGDNGVIRVPETQQPVSVEQNQGDGETNGGDGRLERTLTTLEAVANGHNLPLYKDSNRSITVSDFERKHPKQIDLANRIIEKVSSSGIIEKRDGESDVEYKIRVAEEVEKRLRYVGDYRGGNDEIFKTYLDFRGEKGFNNPARTLMALEAVELRLARENDNDVEFESLRRDVKTEVRSDSDIFDVEGDYEHIFKEGSLEKKGEAQRDIDAFTLIADVLLDIKSDDGKTYRAKMKQAIDNKDWEGLTKIRQEFYDKAFEALRYRNPGSDRHFAPNSVEERMIGVLRGLEGKSVDELIRRYKGVRWEGLSEAHQGRMRGEFSNPQDIFNYALKGAEFFKRRVLYKEEERKLYVGDKIHFKTFVQGGTVGEIEKRKHREPVVPHTPLPTTQPQSPDTPAPAPRTTTSSSPEGEVNPAPASAEGPEVPPAPAGAIEQEPVLTPPPTEHGESSDDDQAPPPPQHEPPKRDILAIVGLTKRRVQNDLRNMEHVRAFDMTHEEKKFRDKILGKFYKTPLFGMVLKSTMHPIKYIWQNAIFRSVFDQQKLRFVADVDDVLKKAIIGEDRSTIPLEVSYKLIDRALEEGFRRKKSQGFFRKRWNSAKDFVKGLTGISQPTEQQYAVKWLKEELNKPENEWAEELREVKQANSSDSYLRSYTNKAETFALVDSPTREDEGLEERMRRADRMVMKQSEGERRVLLSDMLPTEAYNSLNEDVKVQLGRYARGQIEDAELIKEVNKLLESRLLRPHIKEIKDKLGKGKLSEIATNVLNIAKRIRDNRESYESIWGDYKLDIILGRSDEYTGGVRGKVESDFLTEALANRLAERKIFRGEVLGSGYDLVKDALTYGTAGLVSWHAVTTASSLAKFIPKAGAKAAGVAAFVGLSKMNPDTAHRVGVAVGIGGLTALKETGISIPLLKRLRFRIGDHEFHPFVLKGRYLKEVEQVSREAALGRETQEGSKIRPEMERLLVPRVKAVDVVRDLSSILRLSEDMFNDGEARHLMKKLAELDARMRLSDYSGTRRLNYHTQNFIEYTEGRANEEYLRLKQLLLEGKTRLEHYRSEHANFLSLGAEEELFGNFSYESPEDMGYFDKLSALVESQLLFSSQDERRVKKWLISEVGIQEDEINNLTGTFGLDVLAERGDALRAKDKLIRRYSIKRGITVGLQTAILSGGTGLLYTPLHVGLDLAKSEFSALHNEVVAQSLSTVLDNYVHRWEEIFHGDIPVKVDAGGHLVADLSPAQEAILKVEYFLSPDRFSGVIHHSETINGVQMELPSAFKIVQEGGNRGIVDLRNGHVYDISHLHFEVNAKGELMVVDNNSGAVQSATNFFGGASVKAVEKVIEHKITPTPNEHIIIHNPIGGEEIQVPKGVTSDGVHWHADFKYNPSSKTWDLVAAKDGLDYVDPIVDKNGDPVVLVHDIVIHDGHIEGHGPLLKGVQIQTHHETIETKPAETNITTHIEQTPVPEIWEKLSDLGKTIRVHWWRNGTVGEYFKGILHGRSIFPSNEVRAYNSYDPEHDIFHFSIKMGDSWNKPDSSDGVIHVPELLKLQQEGQLPPGTQIGMAFGNDPLLHDAVFRPFDRIDPSHGAASLGLDLKSELGKIIIDKNKLVGFHSNTDFHNREDILNVRYVRVVIRHENPDGTVEYDVLATTRGEGQMPDVVSTPVTETTITPGEHVDVKLLDKVEMTEGILWEDKLRNFIVELPAWRPHLPRFVYKVVPVVTGRQNVERSKRGQDARSVLPPGEISSRTQSEFTRHTARETKFVEDLFGSEEDMNRMLDTLSNDDRGVVEDVNRIFTEVKQRIESIDEGNEQQRHERAEKRRIWGLVKSSIGGLIVDDTEDESDDVLRDGVSVVLGSVDDVSDDIINKVTAYVKIMRNLYRIYKENNTNA